MESLADGPLLADLAIDSILAHALHPQVAQLRPGIDLPALDICQYTDAIPVEPLNPLLSPGTYHAGEPRGNPSLLAGAMVPEGFVQPFARSGLNTLPRALATTLTAGNGTISDKLQSTTPGSGRQDDPVTEQDLPGGETAPIQDLPGRSPDAGIAAPQTPGMTPFLLGDVPAEAAGRGAAPAGDPTAPSASAPWLPVEQAEPETTAAGPAGPAARRSSAVVAEPPASGPPVSMLRNIPEFAAVLSAHQPNQPKPETAEPNLAADAGEVPRSNPMERAIAGQVARSLSGAKAGSDTVIVVRLTPPELGTVRIEIRSERDGLNARLHAEDPAVRESLERLLPTLRGDLRMSDSRLTEISVAPQQHQHDPQQERSDPDARGRGQDPRDAQRDPHRRRQAKRFQNALDLVGSAADG